MLNELSNSLKQGKDLEPSEITSAIDALVSDVDSVEVKARFLSALAEKGESVEEIAGFASQLRSKAVTPILDYTVRQSTILDVCGTGGDHQNTFNISTTVAILAAAAGVYVAKHGNRAVTSKSGSADVLEALGIPVDLPPEEAAVSLKEHGFVFLFAPHYHPAFKHIVPARKLCAANGQRTIFNFLGPLLNPLMPSAQLIGVPKPEICGKLGKVLQSIGVTRGMVVCGEVGDGGHLDEFSTVGVNHVAEFYQDCGFHDSIMSPESFPIAKASIQDLEGGDAGENAEVIRKLFQGKLKGPKLDAVLLNAAAALFVAGRASSMVEGWELASNVLESGQAWDKLQNLSLT
ncbi:MAG: anthranilate phosphoribosyltransferase [Verrucomicrobia bacterium]|nr:anthranilate phosphoribosyltransferase [Verrucomicrobiota bacterium]